MTVNRTWGEVASLLYHGCDHHRGEWIDCEVTICQIVRDEADRLRPLGENLATALVTESDPLGRVLPATPEHNLDHSG